MGTYYKYVDRDVEQNINWFDVGQTVSKSFMDKKEELEKQRAAVNKESNELLKKLNNPDLGQNRNVNTLMIEAGTKLSETQKSFNQLFNDGLMSYNEYLQASEEAKNSADKISKLPKLFNETYTKTMNGIKDNSLSLISADAMTIFTAFADPNTAGFGVDETGRLYMGTKKTITVNGQQVTTLDEDPKKISDVQNLFSLAQNAQVPMYNVKDFTDGVVNESQKFKTIIQNDKATVGDKGYTVTLDDLTRNTKWKGALDTSAEAVAQNPLAVASILKDGLGVIKVVVGKDAQGNDIIENKPIIAVKGKPQAPNEIGLSIGADGNLALDISEEQRKIAKDYLIQQAEAKVNVEFDQEIDAQKRNDDIEYKKIALAKRKMDKDDAKEYDRGVSIGALFGQLRKGTAQEKENAVMALRKNGYKIDITNTGEMLMEGRTFDASGTSDENYSRLVQATTGYNGPIGAIQSGLKIGQKANSSSRSLKGNTTMEEY